MSENGVTARRRSSEGSRRRKSSESVSIDDHPSAHLPIYAHRKELIRQVFEATSGIVIVGETGSGKTTQIPQYLLDSGLLEDGIIGISQPRRVAAISVAHRVAMERGAEVGREVGYTVRFEDCTSPATKIKYMTDGVLLKELLSDRTLSKYSAILLDEAHERSLQTDVLFGLVKKLFIRPSQESKKRVGPRIIVMSATLDTEKFVAFFHCPLYTIPGRLYPVDIIYCDLLEGKDLKNPQLSRYAVRAVEVAMTVHETQKQGHILIFLTGQEEIEKACDLLFKKSENLSYKHDVQDEAVTGMWILPLYGSMATDLQQRVFDPAPRGIRKVVVATNIAATSVTIDGIRYVVDSGMVKQTVFNPRTGLHALVVQPISQSEAKQRAGRAGRTCPGKCYRLYNELAFEEMPDVSVPEIQRTNLTNAVLFIKCCGVSNVLEFDYVDTPPSRALLEALRELIILGAISPVTGEPTEMGRKMSDLPLSPSLSVVLMHAATMGCLDEILTVIACLSVENIFIRPGKDDHEQVTAAIEGLVRDVVPEATLLIDDFILQLIVYEAFIRADGDRRWAGEHFVHARALRTAQSIRAQLLGIVEKQKLPVQSCRSPGDRERNIVTKDMCSVVRHALCYGYFGHVVRRVTGRLVFCTKDGHGNMVQLHPGSQLFGQEAALDWCIYHDVLMTSKTYIRTVAPIRIEWVEHLLPKLHEFDVHHVLPTGIVNKQLRETPENEDDGKPRHAGDANTAQRKQSVSSEPGERDEEVAVSTDGGDAMMTQYRRNDADAVEAARDKYLARKKARLDTNIAKKKKT